MNGSPAVNAPLNFDRAPLEIGLPPKFPVSRVFDNCATERATLFLCHGALQLKFKENFFAGNGRGYAQIEVEKKNSCNTIFVHTVLRIFVEMYV